MIKISLVGQYLILFGIYISFLGVVFLNVGLPLPVLIMEDWR